MLLASLALGLLIGLTLGALGGGGSILTVPVLVYVLGLTAQEATAGSLVIVGVSSAVASIGHARAGHTRWGRGLVLTAAGVPAALLGTVLNRHTDPTLLLLIFGAVMILAAVGMLIRTRSNEDLSPTAPHPRSSGRAAVEVLLAGSGIGLLTGFLGVGGGFVIVPVLVLLLGYAMPVAVGTSLLVIALNSGVALVARLGHGSLVWHVVLPFTIAAVVGSLGGRRVTASVDPDRLTRAFAFLLLAVAAYVLLDTLLG